MWPYYILIVFSVLLFCHGFFPILNTTKTFNSKPPTHINNISLNHNELYTTDFEKVVLIVIDALRLDFANLHDMPLTYNITKQDGCFNTINVETPTVTLPRIKALTAGSVPQFMDLVLNLAGAEILEDSLIHSAFNKQKRVIFYGDDTWLKLFPNFFVRYEGTNSFFVRDFKEVDDNVTRNVDVELEKKDWDMMILHYLGLDHIGHVYGPFSSLVPQKLKEMDDLIFKVYLKMRDQKTLLLITGDHGMRDSGGHGGASFAETHVPLMIIGLSCTSGSFQQTDIPVNLAVLLGLDIPSTSIGQLQENLLKFSLKKFLFVLRYNTLHLLQKITLGMDNFLLATEYHEIYLKTSNESSALKAINLYQNCSNIISDYLIQSSVDQNQNSLLMAILVMVNILIVLFKKLLNVERKVNMFRSLQYFIFLFSILLHIVFANNIICFILMLTLLIILIINLISLSKSQYETSKSFIIIAILMLTTIHPLTFFSSSFIEEEHQFWYFVNSLFILANIIYSSKYQKIKSVFSSLGLLAAIRFLRTINSTGDKWANYPDLSDWLLKNENYYYFQLFFIIGLVAVFYSQLLLMQSRKYHFTILNIIVLTAIFVLKNDMYSNILLGKLVWLLILCKCTFFYNESKVMTWILMSTLLLKPYNTILVPYCILSCLFFTDKYTSTVMVTFCYTWVGNMLYFAQGHSNSLASVDISVGYIGLSEYQPLLVMIQVLCHTYCFPVLCTFLLFRNKHINHKRVWTILFLNRLYILLIICIVTLIFRHHLFIWSVFAPKLFIESIHTLFLFTEFSVYSTYKNIKQFLNKIL